MENIIAKLKTQKGALAEEIGRIDAAIDALSGGRAPAKARASKKARGRKRS